MKVKYITQSHHEKGFSLIAQLVKNPLAMQETWVQSLVWEDPLEKGKDTHQYSGLENSMDCIVRGVEKSQTQLSDFHFAFLLMLLSFYQKVTFSFDI